MNNIVDEEVLLEDDTAPAASVKMTDDGEILVTPRIPEYDVSVLNEGEVYTYKQLTELLNIKYIKGGNAKIKQLTDLGRYVDLKKNGTKYYVNEIYNPPLPQEITFPSYAKYVNEMVDMMLVYLFNKHSETVILDFNELYEVCGLVNKQYLFYGGRKEELAANHDYKNKEVRHFYFVASSFAKYLVKSALEAMSTRKIIKYYSYYDITFAFNKDDEITHKAADDEDLKEILIAEKEALNQLNFKSTREANATYENREAYYNSFNTLIKKRNPYWKKVRKLYKVIAPIEIIINEIVSSVSRKTLNEKVYKYLTEHADTTQKKYNGYLGYTEEWLHHQYALADLLITLQYYN